MQRAWSTLRPLTAIIVAITRLGIYTLRRGSARVPSLPRPPLCLFSHNIRSIIGEIPLTTLLTSRLNLDEIVRKVGGSPKTGRSSSRRAISEIAAAPPFCPTPVRLLINVSFALNIRQPWLHPPRHPLLLSVAFHDLPSRTWDRKCLRLFLLAAALSIFMMATVSYPPSPTDCQCWTNLNYLCAV